MANQQDTYVEFLASALARAKPQRFAADTSKWHQFVFMAKARCPELFRHVVFDTRIPSKPHSDQADHALHVLAQSGLVSVGNPAYRVLEVSTRQKAVIRKQTRSIGAAHKVQIDALARLAESELEV